MSTAAGAAASSSSQVPAPHESVVRDAGGAAALAAAMSDAQYEAMAQAAMLDGPARELFDGLRRKLAARQVKAHET